MLTLPKIVEREAAPYVAIRENVTIPFGPVIDKVMPEMAGWLGARGVETFGPAIFRYNVVRMPALEMEFGFVPPNPPAGDDRVTSGVLPAGRYGTLTYWGHYDNLQEVTAVLIGWAKQVGIAWDADGDRFASRFELYPNGPMDTPDPEKWETQIFIKVRG